VVVVAAVEMVAMAVEMVEAHAVGMGLEVALGAATVGGLEGALGAACKVGLEAGLPVGWPERVMTVAAAGETVCQVAAAALVVAVKVKEVKERAMVVVVAAVTVGEVEGGRGGAMGKVEGSAKAKEQSGT